MQNLEFEFPLLLALIPLYILLSILFKIKQQSYYIPNFLDILPAMQKKKEFKSILKLLIIILSIIALASPIHKHKELDTSLHTLDIVLSLDTSGSMSLKGLNPHDYNQTRVEIVKNVVREFLLTRKEDRLALVVFGDKSAVVSPLSYDEKALLSSLDKITTGVVGKSTALIDSVVQASQLLKNSFSSSKIIILLSDGDDTASKVPLSIALKIIQKYKIKVYTIAIGESNNNLLSLLCKKSGGESFTVQNTDKLKEVYSTITNLEEKTYNKKKKIIIDYYYHYPLALSLFLGFIFALMIRKEEQV